MMRATRRFVALLLLAAIPTLAASSASAQQPSKADLAKADKLYTQGKAALDAGRLDEACTKLAQSLAIDRGVGTLLNLARCHQRQNKNMVAWREYNDARTLAEQRNDPERAKGARELADKLAATLPRMMIDVRSKQLGLAIQRDGADVPASELGAAIPMDPGSHVVTATLAGHETFTTTVQVGTTADTTTVTIGELKKEGVQGSAVPLPSTDPTPTTQPDAGWKPGAAFTAGVVLGGVGLAGIGVGAGFGVLTMNQLSDAEEDPALCPQKECSASGRESVDDAATKGIISTIGFAVGGAALATGIVLIIVDVSGGSDDKKEPSVGVAPGPGDVGTAVRWSF